MGIPKGNGRGSVCCQLLLDRRNEAVGFRINKLRSVIQILLEFEEIVRHVESRQNGQAIERYRTD